jgi:hypothetical protein
MFCGGGVGQVSGCLWHTQYSILNAMDTNDMLVRSDSGGQLLSTVCLRRLFVGRGRVSLLANLDTQHI